MKKTFLYLSVLWMSFMVLSCDQENKRTMYDLQGKDYVSFPVASIPVGIDINGSNNTFTIPVNHVNPDAASASAVVSIDDNTPENILSIFSIENGNVSFKQGAAQENVNVTFNRSALQPGVSYAFNVVLNNYGELYPIPTVVDTMRVTVSLELTWVKIATGLFESIDVMEEEWEQDLEQALEMPTLYRFPNLYANSFHIIFTMENDGSISLTRQRIGWNHSSYGPYSVTQCRESYPQAYKEGEIIHFWCELVVDAGSFGAMEEVFSMGPAGPPPPPVYDYSADIAFTGRFTNVFGQDFALADVTLGDDVEFAKVALVPGKWSDDIIDGIEDGSIESERIEESGMVSFSCDISGEYTYVVVTYAEDEAKEAAYVTFLFPPSCPMDPSLLVGEFDYESEEWDEAGYGLVFEADEDDEYKVFIDGYPESEGLTGSGNRIELNVNPADFSISGPAVVIADDMLDWGLDYTGYSFEPVDGLFNPCDGTYTVYFLIRVDQGAFGIFEFVFTPSVDTSSAKAIQQKSKSKNLLQLKGAIERKDDISKKGHFTIPQKVSPKKTAIKPRQLISD